MRRRRPAGSGGIEHDMTPDHDVILGGRSWRRRSWMQRLARSNALTMTVSLGLHSALFITFYQVVFREEPTTRQIIIPEARLAPAGGPAERSSGQMPRLNPRPSPPPADAGPRPVGSAGLADASPLQLSELPVVAVDLAGHGSSLLMSGSPGTVAGGAGSGPAGSGGSLMGAGYGPGGGGGGGGWIGPATGFFGASGNAYKVVYLIDVSNSLMATLDREIAAEMKKAIQNLTASQQFHVILATPVRVIEFSPRRLVYATSANKKAAMQFIDENVRLTQDLGAHAPVEGLRRAFDVGPELIYFVSDGDFLLEDQRAALKAIVAQKSPRGEIKLTTLGFGSGDRSLLEQLARQTGGHFRYTDYK